MDFARLPFFFWPYLLVGILYFAYIIQRKKERFFYLSRGLFVYIFIYLAALEGRQNSYYFLIPLGFFGFFYLFYRHQRAQMINGFLFNLFMVAFGLYLLYNFTVTKDRIIFALISVIALMVIAVVLFGFIGLTLLLYWNAAIVIKREAHSLANLLTLILALLLTGWLLYNHFISQLLPNWAVIFIAILPLMFLYFAVVFLNFLTASILYQFNRPKYMQDFVIVLGAGLVNGKKVTPLLAGRIDRAIHFYHKQLKRSGHPLKLILSGGQGPDEKVPEAIAMKEYALDKGIPDEDLLVEVNSTSTLENMQFSREIITNSAISNPQVIFASNNYHIFRAGIFAAQAHLKALGIGSRTALYYLPNAFLREFIAIVAMNRKRHFRVVALLGILTFIFGLFTLLI